MRPQMDIAALMSRKAEEDTPVDDGSGKLEVWVIKDFKKVPLDPARCVALVPSMLLY